MTPFGTLLRQERMERGMLLGDLAKALKISVPYLSQIETGQRFVPDGFEDKVTKVLGFTQCQKLELDRAAAQSRSNYSLTLGASAPVEDRSLAHDLAMSFARLSPEAKQQIRNAIEESNRGK